MDATCELLNTVSGSSLTPPSPSRARGARPDRPIRKADVRAIRRQLRDALPDYRRLRFMTSGGRCLIFRAVYQGRAVVVKTPRKDCRLHTDLEALRREAEALRALQSECIPRPLDARTVASGGISYIILPALRAIPLSSCRHGWRSWVFRTALRNTHNMNTLRSTIRSTLEEVHRSGRVHGDLSLGNILIRFRWEFPFRLRLEKAWLVDFGGSLDLYPEAIYPPEMFVTRRFVTPNRRPGKPIQSQDDFDSLELILETLSKRA